MLQSKLFTKTSKTAPADEVSKNAKLLIQGGFVHKEMAGVYNLLPLGFMVVEKIKNIIRDELNKINANEMHMTTLQQSEKWEKTGRWSDEVVDDWFKTELKNGTKLGLAFTHEEPITNIMTNFISSYKDLPFSAYQFQTKFRNELRAKSGVMRGREFLMKDLYSFSKNKEEHDKFYENIKEVYKNIFERIGIGERTFLTISSGGSFSKYSYEFQTLSEAGEDVLVFDRDKNIAINKDDFNNDVLNDFNLNKDDLNFEEEKSIEVGDIYSLGTKYSEAMGLTYKNEEGKETPVYMGSYGIGISRLMGTVVEIFNDNKGIVWPENIAPFKVHLINIGEDEKAKELYDKLQSEGVEVLWDDRDKRPGEKFGDSDLIGIPNRVVISPKTLSENGVELKYRNESDGEIISVDELLKKLLK